MLEESSLGVGFEVSEAQVRSSSHAIFLLPVDPDIELNYFLSTMSVSLPPCSRRDDNGLTETVRQPQLYAFCHRSHCAHGVSSEQQNTDEDTP